MNAEPQGQGLKSPLLKADPHTVNRIDLNSAIKHLGDQLFTSPENQSRLQHSRYERARTSANIECARTLLLRLEHDSASLKIQSQKVAAQTSLSAQRAQMKRLSDRIQEFERTGDDSADWQGSDDEEDLLAIADDEEPETTSASAARAETGTSGLGKRRSHRAPSESHRASESRDIKSHTQASKPDGETTPTAFSTGVFDSRPKDPTSTSTAQILEANSSTQEALTSSLVRMATQLKQSSQAFATSLESDTAHLNRAVEGLDRNTSGMDAAGGKMGLLRKMSEGKGWWGRMMLYAWIAGLWVVAILLVGVAPKLRF